MRILGELINTVRQGKLPCLFHIMTGAYCPGCGGTRALRALMEGHVMESLRLHPLVPFLAAAIPALLFYWIFCVIRKRRMRPLVIKSVLWGGLGILVINFLVKNYYLLVLHVDLLVS